MAKYTYYVPTFSMNLTRKQNMAHLKYDAVLDDAESRTFLCCLGFEISIDLPRADHVL